MAVLLTVLLAFLAAGLTKGQVTQAEFNKSTAFKEKFLKFNKECAKQYDVTFVEVMPLFVKSEDEKSKSSCYIYCMLEKYKLMNPKGSYINGNFQRFLDTMPESRFKKSIQATTQKCVHEDSEEPCVKAYKFTRCIYKNGAGKNTPQ